MKKKTLTKLMVASVLGGVVLLTNNDLAFAHGYVETPPARGYQGKLDMGNLGWTEALNLYGNVITNPQSLEAPKGFPVNGPADGRIASANGGYGQIGDYILDNQTSQRWKKTAINSGETTFTWYYTAPHKTAKWHYYMTKAGWDQNSPLVREELELIGTIDHDGSIASTNLSHTVNIPQNRLGYHVVLAVWDVEDTGNAFYNVIDVNVNSQGELPSLPTKPTTPTNLKTTNVTKSTVSLTWDSQTSAGKFNVYRDGVKVATVNGNQFAEGSLKADQEYQYQIEALSATGVTSDKSQELRVRTLAESDVELPTAPRSLHSMGETQESVSLMWGKSTHTSGIKKYDIYRDGQKIAETEKTIYKDTGLKAGTQYRYVVIATSNEGSLSDRSNELVLSTKVAETLPGDHREFKLGSFTQPELYMANELVSYQGERYVSLVTHYNYGDSSWNPSEAISLFNKQ